MKQIAFGMTALLWALGVMAQTGVVTKTSSYSVSEAMDRIEAAVRAADGWQVFSRIDLQALSASQKGKMRASQILLFGRGVVLPALLTQRPVAAIDLPLKILVWEDETGSSMVSLEH